MAHSYYIASIAAGLFVDPAPGPVLANYGVDNLRFGTRDASKCVAPSRYPFKPLWVSP